MGWPEVNLGKVLTVQPGFAFKSELFHETEGMPLIRIRDLGTDTTKIRYTGQFKNEFVVRAGEFLIGMDGDFICHEWRGGDALLNQRVCRLTSFDRSLVVPKFIYYRIQSALNAIHASTPFVTVKHVSGGQIGSIKLELPTLSEQHRIVDLLDEADRLRKVRVETDAKVERVLTAIFLKMFGDPATNPMGWESKPLSEACQEIYRYPTYYGITYVPSGVPEIRGELLVGDGSIETDASKFRYISSETAAKFPRTALLEGDIVMSVRGTIGKLGLVPRTLQGANITANLLRISPNRSLVRPRYLFAFLSSSAGVRQISSITTSTTISTFRASDFQKLMLPIPPLPEQDRFVSLATEFVATLEAIGFAGKAIDAAWNVLREHAFSGRLTSNWRVEHMTELRAEMKEQARLLKLPMPTEMDSSL